MDANSSSLRLYRPPLWSLCGSTVHASCRHLCLKMPTYFSLPPAWHPPRSTIYLQWFLTHTAFLSHFLLPYLVSNVTTFLFSVLFSSSFLFCILQQCCVIYILYWKWVFYIPYKWCCNTHMLFIYRSIPFIPLYCTHTSLIPYVFVRSVLLLPFCSLFLEIQHFVDLKKL